jgi:hypothetical protein
MAEPIFVKYGMYIMARESISKADIINPSHQSVYSYAYPLIVITLFGKKVTAATNIHATIKELLDAPFRVPSLSYQKKVVD